MHVHVYALSGCTTSEIKYWILFHKYHLEQKKKTKMINYLGKYRKHVKHILPYRKKAWVAILELNFPWNNKVRLFSYLLGNQGWQFLRLIRIVMKQTKKKQNKTEAKCITLILSLFILAQNRLRKVTVIGDPSENMSP